MIAITSSVTMDMCSNEVWVQSPFEPNIILLYKDARASKQKEKNTDSIKRLIDTQNLLFVDKFIKKCPSPFINIHQGTQKMFCHLGSFPGERSVVLLVAWQLDLSHHY